jgi:hypothetical protein
MIKNKICRICKQPKLLNEFYPRKGNKDGLRSECIECGKKDSSARRKNNPEKYRKIQRLWRLNNLEKSRKWHNDWMKNNPEKAKVWQEALKKNNPNGILNSVLEYRHGITLKQYNEMLEEQNHCCKICKKHKSEFKKRLYVDHDHKTGIIRGLLCNKCNKLLGDADDNKEILSNAITYLR